VHVSKEQIYQDTGGWIRKETFRVYTSSKSSLRYWSDDEDPGEFIDDFYHAYIEALDYASPAMDYASLPPALPLKTV